MPFDEQHDPARDLLDFIYASPTPYHAVSEAARRLRLAGFSEYFEADEWEIAEGARGYVIRDGALIAFVAGRLAPARSGFIVLGAHTDSPNLRVKPVPDLGSSGFWQLSIEVYGGVLLTTWLDRDLALAGRLIERNGRAHLVRTDRPICRIPNVAIHLNRDVNSAGLTVNPQTQLTPILARDAEGSARSLLAFCAAQSDALDVRDIAGFDLCLYDAHAGTLGGARDEFIFSARLDNLASCHACIEALTASGAPGAGTRVVALYDHEEVGSQSAAGARSTFLQSVLERVTNAYPNSGSQAFARACAKSFLISVDMAHALHPNYPDKHDKNHVVRLGNGPVIKSNANQSYATDGVTLAIFRAACEGADFSPQYFVSRNDMPCGSTIGPITAARLGIRSVDVGNPMLSMHSCREMAARADVQPMISALTAVFQNEGQRAVPETR